MTPETKKRIRALLRKVPRMVKASLVKQVFELEKVVTSTFEFTDEMQELFQGVPQNHLELAAETYNNKMYRAYQGGHKAAKDAQSKVRLGEDLLKEIRLKMPMSYSLGEDLLASFKAEIDEHLQTVPDKGEIYSQFKKDLEMAYLEGAMDYFHEITEQTMGEEPEPEPEPVEPSEEEESTETPSDKESEEDMDKKEATAATKEEMLSKLEEYAKLLGEDWKEDVLRTTLGLPPKTATAAVSSSSMIGPYDVGALREKILSAVKAMDLDEQDLQVSVVECLVSDLNGYNDQELARVVEKRLDIVGSLPEEATRDDVRLAVDVIAQRLNEKVDLPGELHFLEVNGDYCLVFAFEKEQAKDLATASLPSSPQGPLSVKDQKEIKALADLKRTSSLKEIRTASSRVASHLGKVLTDLRNSRLNLSEGARALKASMEDLVAAVYGEDGKAYYLHLKGK